jgi:hypothetical protein
MSCTKMDLTGTNSHHHIHVDMHASSRQLPHCESQLARSLCALGPLLSVRFAARQQGQAGALLGYLETSRATCATHTDREQVGQHKTSGQRVQLTQTERGWSTVTQHQTSGERMADRRTAEDAGHGNAPRALSFAAVVENELLRRVPSSGGPPQEVLSGFVAHSEAACMSHTQHTLTLHMCTIALHSIAHVHHCIAFRCTCSHIQWPHPSLITYTR